MVTVSDLPPNQASDENRYPDKEANLIKLFTPCNGVIQILYNSLVTPEKKFIMVAAT